MKNTHSLLLPLLLLTTLAAHANVHPANIFNTHMVLQRNIPIRIWGWADHGEKVAISFHKQRKEAYPRPDGKWEIMLEKEQAGGPYTMTIAGKDTVTFDDVLVGEVWVCSGQSNMEWILADVINGKAEVAAANYPQIRHIDIPNKTSLDPLEDFEKAPWKVCTPDNAGQFTAVGYFFARKLYEELKVPIGLVNASWGGTICETWVSKESLLANPEFKPIAATLPRTITEYERQEKQKLRARIEQFEGKVDPNETADGWESPSWNDADWKTLHVPQAWEDQGLEDFDGVVWFRKEITLTEAQALQPATLYLGVIDDCDSTYLNGQKIGTTCWWDAPRKYPVPAGLLKPGRNLIAVKAIDWGGGGGFYGEDKTVKLMVGNDSLSLVGPWKARIDQQAIQTDMGPNTMPTLLFNGMMSPIIPFGIKGAIWYQGESNVPRAAQYAGTFPMLINDWRKLWKLGDFPFYFVQLASFLLPEKNTLEGSDWAELRDAQRQTLSVPHTGMAVTTDIGDAKDIHPKNKQDVGLRLALHALKNDYGKNIENSGPLYRSMKISGNKIEITFDHVGSGLTVHNKYGYLFGFSIAGADQQFKWAQAYIQGDKVVVFSEAVPNPVAVRFGWIDNPEETNLFNKEGLPASPFRTDDWKLKTAGNKY